MSTGRVHVSTAVPPVHTDSCGRGVHHAMQISTVDTCFLLRGDRRRWMELCMHSIGEIAGLARFYFALPQRAAKSLVDVSKPGESNDYIPS